MKVDPFRAHLKFGQQKKLDGGRAIAPLHAGKKLDGGRVKIKQNGGIVRVIGGPGDLLPRLKR